MGGPGNSLDTDLNYKTENVPDFIVMNSNDTNLVLLVLSSIMAGRI